MVMLRSAGIRATVIALGAVALTVSGVVAPAQAATKEQMTQTLLTRVEVNRLLPGNAGRLFGVDATKTTARYTSWGYAEGGEVSVTGLATAHLKRGQKARPRDVRPSFGSEWSRISRTDDRLVQYKEAFAGEAVRVVIFRGRNAVAAECEQVAGSDDKPPVPRKELRACATRVAEAQYAKLREVVG